MPTKLKTPPALASGVLAYNASARLTIAWTPAWVLAEVVTSQRNVTVTNHQEPS
ncbi:hypothetical protein [Nostoc sp.]|uniref:hypothetical protein n=1 Tax=Nostoc sp. TaxID=1180 RepID=UPI002FF65CD5